MKIFLTIWSGQLFSLIGTGMTRFALLIWAYQQTESPLTVAILGLSSFIPIILISPFAGVLTDRYDRRRIMLVADLGAGLMTLGLLLLFVSDHLVIWHLFLAEGLAGFFEAFQYPAFTALTTRLLPPHAYSRAAGYRAIAQNGSQIAAPLLAGAFLPWIDIDGIMIIDVITFMIAAAALLLVPIPAAVYAGQRVKNSRYWPEMRAGLSYIRRRPGLIGLLIVFAGMNFFASLTYFSILPAMVLARSGQNEIALALVQGTLGGAGVLGGLILSLWGGPKRKIHGILAGGALSFLGGDLLFALGRTPASWVAAAAIAAVFIPFIGGSDVTIWQSKVDPALQGRVFGVRTMVQQAAMPFGFFIGGWLAEMVLEPAMMPGGALTPIFEPLVGSGPGAGMALMFACTAILGTLMSLSGYLFRPVRQIEDELPDFKPNTRP